MRELRRKRPTDESQTKTACKHAAYRVRKTDSAQSRRILLVLSALVEINQVGDRDNIGAVGDAVLLFLPV